MRATQNIVCLRHPHYNDADSPDLACKICCSKFVARIRAEQNNQFEATWNRNSVEQRPEFEPLKPAQPAKAEAASKRRANFDGSWI
jgi:hypothetical protein